MRWEDERYVKLYTRDTVTWLSLSFDAQSVLMMLLRKADGAGLVTLGPLGLRGLAMVLGHRDQIERVERAVQELIALEVCRVEGGHIVVVHYIAAQEAQASPSARKRVQRERDRDQLRANGIEASGMVSEMLAQAARSPPPDVTPVVTQEVTQAVTQQVTPGSHANGHDVGHAESHDVGHDPAQPSSAQLSPAQKHIAPEPAPRAPKKRAKRTEKPPADPPDHAFRELTDAVCAAHLELRGEAMEFLPRDAVALVELRKRHADDEILTRWRRGLAASTDWLRIHNLGQLRQKWGDLAPKGKQGAPSLGPGPPSGLVCAVCDAPGSDERYVAVVWGQPVCMPCGDAAPAVASNAEMGAWVSEQRFERSGFEQQTGDFA